MAEITERIRDRSDAWPAHINEYVQNALVAFGVAKALTMHRELAQYHVVLTATLVEYEAVVTRLAQLQLSLGGDVVDQVCATFKRVSVFAPRNKHGIDAKIQRVVFVFVP